MHGHYLYIEQIFLLFTGALPGCFEHVCESSERDWIQIREFVKPVYGEDSLNGCVENQSESNQNQKN